LHATIAVRALPETVSESGLCLSTTAVMPCHIEEESIRMSRSFEEIETEAMSLDLQGRAQLAEKLLLSLDAPSDEENLRLWVAEAEQRLQELREGKAKEIPANEAFRKARAALS
jgi:hypothetical protein